MIVVVIIVNGRKADHSSWLKSFVFEMTEPIGPKFLSHLRRVNTDIRYFFQIFSYPRSASIIVIAIAIIVNERSTLHWVIRSG